MHNCRYITAAYSYFIALRYSNLVTYKAKCMRIASYEYVCNFYFLYRYSGLHGTPDIKEKIHLPGHSCIELAIGACI